ncbi:MAG TPA: diaminopimelate decarboxylase [bacterium]|nr:diaminopimelate decarboxylase [bacterium]
MNIQGIKIADLAEKYGTPFYVYDFNRVKEKLEKIKKAFHFDEKRCEIFYAMKANSHPVLLDLIRKKNIGIDAVSPGEVEVALKAGIAPEKILYTGNFESDEDLARVYEQGVRINLDNSSSLDKLLKIGKPEIISFRINPGQGSGKYEHITTGGEKAKFGIPVEQVLKAYKKAQNAGIEKFGIHTFLGSGILDEDHFPEVVELLLEKAHYIKSKLNIRFDFMDIGGGFGINYFAENKRLDIKETGRRSLEKFDELVDKYDLGSPHLAIEPGRYIIGDSGFLVTKVTSIKESFRKYVGVNAGFNILLRPALYGAEHDIVIDGKENLAKSEKVDICGQICENTDIFARDRKLPPVDEGDLLIFKQAGAYANAMSMPYNMRMRTAEVGILDGQEKLITRHENLDDFYNRILVNKM